MEPQLSRLNKNFPGVVYDLSAVSFQDHSLSLLAEAAELSESPISSYKVGAFAVSSEGHGVLASNLEFLRNTLNEAIHGEQSAVVQAHSLGWKRIEKLFVNAAPCGHCRQFLLELGDPKELIIAVTGEDECDLNALIPHYFGPSELGNSTFLLDSASNPEPRIAKLAESYSDNVISNTIRAASRSYCPYTEAFGGVGLQLDTGETIYGSYLESVAYNPSVSPAHYAAVLISNRISLSEGSEIPKVVRAVLATTASNKVSHYAPMSRILNALADSGGYKCPEIEVVNI